MIRAVCPGSFDPVTLGHLDIIRRAAALFDEVIVLVSVNPDKKYTFTAQERIALLAKCTAGLSNVRIDCHEGLLVDYMDKSGANVIVKGLRAVSDYEYEFQMSLTNKKLNPRAETLFLNTSQEYMFLSSSMVKQVAQFGGDISPFIPKEILKDVEARLNKGDRDGN